MNKRVKYLIIFICVVSFVSATLTFVYLEKYENKHNNVETFNYLPVNFDINSINNEKIEFIDGKVYIEDFSLNHDNNNGWVININILNTYDQNIVLDDDYKIYLYDSNKNIIETFGCTIIPVLKANENTNVKVFVLFDGSLVKYVELKKASE